MKCFYHSADLDGQCSGAIIKNKFLDCKMIGINYGDEFPWKTIRKGETIFMVDFCLQPFSDMMKLSEMTDLIWIDHHKSAIDVYIENNASFTKFTDIDYAGCELTYMYINKCCFKDVPYYIKLLGRYDVWKHDEDENILSFQYGMQRYDTNPNNTYFWKNLNHRDYIQDIIKEGKIIKSFVDRENSNYARAKSYEVDFEGYKCICLNGGIRYGSSLFDGIDNKDEYDIMIVFSFNSKNWTVSLYSTKENVDVSEIAKKYGGGGHKGASGFQIDNINKILVKK